MNAKKKAPIELQLVEANRIRLEGKESMHTTLPVIGHKYEIATIDGRVWLESERDFWGAPELAPNVRISAENGSHFVISAPEALSIAAALNAVAVRLMDTAPREIHRHTKPGNPPFEDDV